MTKDEKRHLNLVASLGCIPCLLDGFPHTPAEIHHPRAGTGMARRASHYDAIPLCPAHHRGTNHPHTPSIHMDKHRFIEQYGTEADLLVLTRRALELVKENIV